MNETPTTAAMQAARTLLLVQVGDRHVTLEEVAAALVAYAAEQCLIRHAGRAILAEAERDAALARAEAAEKEIEGWRDD